MKIREYMILLFSPKNSKMNFAFIVTCLTQCAISIFSPISMLFLGKTIDAISNFQNQSAKVITGLLIINLIIFISTLIREKTQIKSVYLLQEKFRTGLFLNMFEEKNQSMHGSFFELVTNQVSEFSFELVQTAIKFIETIFSLISIIIMLLFLAPSFALCIIIVAAIISFFTIKVMGIASRTHEFRQKSDREYLACVSEIVALRKELRVFPIKEFFTKKYLKSAKNKVQYDIKHMWAVFFCRSAEKLGSALLYVLVLAFGVVQINKGLVSYGEVVALLGYSGILIVQISQINYLYDMWRSNTEIYKEILSHNVQVENNSHIDLWGGEPFSVNMITSNNLSFAYGEHSVLQNIDFHISRGDRLILLGASGTGKSALLKLLTKEIVCNDGMIFVNSVDINCFSSFDLREKIAYLSQISFLFNSSVADNIRWASPKLSENEIEELLRKVKLDYLPKNASVGESGNKLSGGERQRLAFARCLTKIHSADIFIFDEPFSQLDEENKNILEKLIGELENKIIILATHRSTELSGKTIELEKAP